MRRVVGLAFALSVACVHAGELRELRLLGGPESTRVVLDLDAQAGSSVFTLDNPNRVVIDLKAVRRGAKLNLKLAPQGVVKNVRSGFGPRGDGLRLVLDLDGPATPKSFGLQPAGDYGYRLIVDLYPVSSSPKPATAIAPAAVQTPPPPSALAEAPPAVEHKTEAAPAAAAAVSAPAPAVVAAVEKSSAPVAAEAVTPAAPARQASAEMHDAPAVVPLQEKPAAPVREAAAEAVPAAPVHEEAAAAPVYESRQGAAPQPLKPIVVAVDAGHGGDDPGTQSRGGVQEKDVTLAISRLLARRIDAQPGMRAVLTRDGDYYVGLRERTIKARDAQADLFVSIHCNSYRSSSMHGTAVYALSGHGANTEQARWLANRENAADLVGGVDIHDKDDRLAAVLLDISQSATMDASFDLASRLLHSLHQVNDLQKPVVQQAGFMVLKSPDIPSVLVETAFLSNAHEERLLRNPASQARFADAIFDGIRSYFARYRPLQQVTASAPDGAEKKSRRHRHQGDTVAVNYQHGERAGGED